MQCQLTKKEKLLYHIIFDDVNEFLIDLVDYADTKCRGEFREEIRLAIIKSGKKIIDDKIINTESTIMWKLKLK